MADPAPDIVDTNSDLEGLPQRPSPAHISERPSRQASLQRYQRSNQLRGYRFAVDEFYKLDPTPNASLPIDMPLREDSEHFTEDVAFESEARKLLEKACNSMLKKMKMRVFVCYRDSGRDQAIAVPITWLYRYEEITNTIKTVQMQLFSALQQDGDESASRANMTNDPTGDNVGERKKKIFRRLSEEQKNSWLAAEGCQEQSTVREILEAYFTQQGKWKRYLWCYDIKAVEEVKFHPDDIERNGTWAVTMYRPTEHLEELSLQAERDRREAEAANHDDCWPYPTELCQEVHASCPRQIVEDADHYFWAVPRLCWWLQCFQDPDKAKHRKLFQEGLLYPSCMYPMSKRMIGNKKFRVTGTRNLPKDNVTTQLQDYEEFRGIYIEIGWNLPRMLMIFRSASVWGLVAATTALLAAVVAGRRDESIGLSTGQLVAALFALVIHKTV